VEYVTGAQVMRWLSDNVRYATDADGGSLEDLADNCALAANRQVEQDCGRVFYALSNQARESRVDLDGTVPLVDLTSSAPTVLVDADGDDVAETPLTAFQLLPRTDGLGQPATRFQLLRALPVGDGLLQPGRLVQVTGNWGYLEDAEAPTPIRTAALLRAAQLWMRRSAPLGVAITFVDGNAVQRVAKVDHNYADLIAPYRRGGWEVS